MRNKIVLWAGNLVYESGDGMRFVKVKGIGTPEICNPDFDLNNDGEINSADVQIVLNASQGMPCAAVQGKSCDLNCEGNVNAVDVHIIINKVIEEGSEPLTCSNLYGDVCEADEICPGNWLTSASDTDRCCDISCQEIDTTAPEINIISPEERILDISTIDLKLMTNEQADCYYSFSFPVNAAALAGDESADNLEQMIKFQNTGDLEHNQILNSLQTGEYKIYIRCEDVVGNIGSAILEFKLGWEKQTCTTEHKKGYRCNLTINEDKSYDLECKGGETEHGEWRGVRENQTEELDIRSNNHGVIIGPIVREIRENNELKGWYLTVKGKENNHHHPSWSVKTCGFYNNKRIPNCASNCTRNDRGFVYNNEGDKTNLNERAGQVCEFFASSPKQGVCIDYVYGDGCKRSLPPNRNYIMNQNLISAPKLEHVVGDNDDYQVFCYPETCRLINAEWSKRVVNENEEVELIINAQGDCIGREVHFEVWEDDDYVAGENDPIQMIVGDVILENNIATASWTAEFQTDGFLGLGGNPEFIFKASLVDNPNVIIETEEDLIVERSNGETAKQECENQGGCYADDYCYDVGDRIEDDQNRKFFCKEAGNWDRQQSIGGPCEEDYWCESGSCGGGKCVEMVVEGKDCGTRRYNGYDYTLCSISPSNNAVVDKENIEFKWTSTGNSWYYGIELSRQQDPWIPVYQIYYNTGEPVEEEGTILSSLQLDLMGDLQTISEGEWYWKVRGFGFGWGFQVESPVRRLVVEGNGGGGGGGGTITTDCIDRDLSPNFPNGNNPYLSSKVYGKTTVIGEMGWFSDFCGEVGGPYEDRLSERICMINVYPETFVDKPNLVGVMHHWCRNGCSDGACICDETNNFSDDDCPEGNYMCYHGRCIQVV